MKSNIRLQDSLKYLLWLSYFCGISRISNKDFSNFWRNKYFIRIPEYFWNLIFIVEILLLVLSIILIFCFKELFDLLSLTNRFLVLLMFAVIIRTRECFNDMLDRLTKLACLTYKDHKIIAIIGNVATLYVIFSVILMQICFCIVGMPQYGLTNITFYSGNSQTSPVIEKAFSYNNNLMLAMTISYSEMFLLHYIIICYILKTAFYNCEQLHGKNMTIKCFFTLLKYGYNLSRLVNYFSRKLSWNFFPILTFVTIVCYIRVFRMFVYTETALLNVVITSAMIFCGFMPLVTLLCIITTKTKEAANLTKHSIQMCLGKFHNHCNIYNVNFVLQTLDIDFTVCNIFKIDITLVFSILGASLTYGVMFATLFNSTNQNSV